MEWNIMYHTNDCRSMHGRRYEIDTVTKSLISWKIRDLNARIANVLVVHGESRVMNWWWNSCT